MLALIATYAIHDLNRWPNGPVFLNNNEMIAGEFYKVNRPAALEVWRQGVWHELPPQARKIVGLNNSNQVAIFGREGWGIWQSDKLTICEYPLPQQYGIPPRPIGEPIGIDESGALLGAEDELEGVFRISSWPRMTYSTFQRLPRPIALGPDGAWSGYFPRGRMFTSGEEPNTFLVFGKEVFPIGAGKITALPTAVSSSHTVVGSYSTWISGVRPWRIPFSWSHGKFTPLPIPTDAQEGVAQAVNKDGVIVGEVDNRAVVWRNAKMEYLDDLIGPSTPYTVGLAYAINDKGEIIASGKKRDGSSYPTLLMLKPN